MKNRGPTIEAAKADRFPGCVLGKQWKHHLRSVAAIRRFRVALYQIANLLAVLEQSYAQIVVGDVGFHGCLAPGLRDGRSAFAIAVDRNKSALLEAERNGSTAVIELDMGRDLRDRERKIHQTLRVLRNRVERKA